ncbi:MAG: hypothetical protein CVV13_07280 [Gammaproteobacteria bacterium HGW-Gammaproteobacteria-3]|nr:MAG: hypothetical protein CVV13_07280 [Gammaproteobacteria bacterium HGW-Gammaproteobacteria-3]
MTTAPSTLIIPVENQVRELDAKLLLACIAAERGFPVVIGSRTFVNFAMPFLPRGVFLAKSLRAQSGLMMNFIRDLGHDIIAWDEESLVRYDAPDYYPWRYSADTFRLLSHLFAWGVDDAEFFTRYEGYPGTPIHVTGNPRIDLLRPELRTVFNKDADALRDRYGDFILINTNFSFVNAFAPELSLIQTDETAGEVRVSRTGRGMSAAFAQSMAAHQQAIFEHFRTLLPELSRWFPHHTIVLRPHPSENHGLWREIVALSGCDNIQVIHEGNVVPWLMACRVLLHNGCTTAVEAAVLGTPAVSYMPVKADCHDYHLPNSLSHRADTTEQVQKLLDAVLTGALGAIGGDTRERVLARHLTATEGPLAAERVIDELIAAGYRDNVPPRPRPLPYIKAWFGANYRTLGKRVNWLRPRHRNSKAYHQHRFPDVSAAQLQARIDQLGERLGRFDGLQVKPLSRYLFSLSAEHDSPSNKSS